MIDARKKARLLRAGFRAGERAFCKSLAISAVGDAAERASANKVDGEPPDTSEFLRATEVLNFIGSLVRIEAELAAGNEIKEEQLTVDYETRDIMQAQFDLMNGSEDDGGDPFPTPIGGVQ